MSESEEVICDLHKMMKEGATVSKCIRVIRSRLEVGHREAIEVFRTAFCLGPDSTQKLMGGFSTVDDANTQQGLATFLSLPDIIQNRDKWDDICDEMTADWFDSLANNSRECIESKAQATIKDDKNWDAVPAAIREQYLTAERSRLMLSEYGEIISRLAERLQLRIDELEREKQECSTS